MTSVPPLLCSTPPPIEYEEEPDDDSGLSATLTLEDEDGIDVFGGFSPSHSGQSIKLEEPSLPVGETETAATSKFVEEHKIHNLPDACETETDSHGDDMAKYNYEVSSTSEDNISTKNETNDSNCQLECTKTQSSATVSEMHESVSKSVAKENEIMLEDIPDDCSDDGMHSSKTNMQDNDDGEIDMNSSDFFSIRRIENLDLNSDTKTITPTTITPSISPASVKKVTPEVHDSDDEFSEFSTFERRTDLVLDKSSVCVEVTATDFAFEADFGQLQNETQVQNIPDSAIRTVSVPTTLALEDDEFDEFQDFSSALDTNVITKPNIHTELSSDKKPQEKPQEQQISDDNNKNDCNVDNNNDDDDDEFGDFAEATVSSSVGEKKPQPSLDMEGFHDRVKKILEDMFPLPPANNDTDNQSDIEIQPIEKHEGIFRNIGDPNTARALKFQWEGSRTREKLIKSLGIDTRNILFGENWNPSMPRYAANLSGNPLQPLKSQTTSTATVYSSDNIPSSSTSVHKITESGQTKKDIADDPNHNPFDASQVNTLLLDLDQLMVVANVDNKNLDYPSCCSYSSPCATTISTTTTTTTDSIDLSNATIGALETTMDITTTNQTIVDQFMSFTNTTPTKCTPFTKLSIHATNNHETTACPRLSVDIVTANKNNGNDMLLDFNYIDDTTKPTTTTSSTNNNYYLLNNLNDNNTLNTNLNLTTINTNPTITTTTTNTTTTIHDNNDYHNSSVELNNQYHVPGNNYQIFNNNDTSLDLRSKKVLQSGEMEKIQLEAHKTAKTTDETEQHEKQSGDDNNSTIIETTSSTIPTATATATATTTTSAYIDTATTTSTGISTTAATTLSTAISTDSISDRTNMQNNNNNTNITNSSQRCEDIKEKDNNILNINKQAISVGDLSTGEDNDEVIATSTYAGPLKETHIYTPPRSDGTQARVVRNPTSPSLTSRSDPVDFDYEKAAAGIIIDETVVKKEYRDVEYNPSFALESNNTSKNLSECEDNVATTVSREFDDDFTEFQSVAPELAQTNNIPMHDNSPAFQKTKQNVFHNSRTATPTFSDQMILSPAVLLPQVVSMNNKPNLNIEWGGTAASINPDELARIEELFAKPKVHKTKELTSTSSNSSQKATPKHYAGSTVKSHHQHNSPLTISATIAMKEHEENVGDDDDWSDFVSVPAVSKKSQNQTTTTTTTSNVIDRNEQYKINHNSNINTNNHNNGNDDDWSDFVSSAPAQQPVQFNSSAWQNANFYNNPLSFYHPPQQNKYHNQQQQQQQQQQQNKFEQHKINNNNYNVNNNNLLPQEVHVLPDFSTATPIKQQQQMPMQMDSSKVSPSISLIPDLGFVGNGLYANVHPKSSLSMKK